MYLFCSSVNYLIEKKRLCLKFWWPGMNQNVNDYVSKYNSHQVVTPVKKKTLSQMKSNNAAWLVLDCDYCGLFPSGESLLVCMDYYSCYSDFEMLHKQTC